MHQKSWHQSDGLWRDVGGGGRCGVEGRGRLPPAQLWSDKSDGWFPPITWIPGAQKNYKQKNETNGFDTANQNHPILMRSNSRPISELLVAHCMGNAQLTVPKLAALVQRVECTKTWIFEIWVPRHFPFRIIKLEQLNSMVEVADSTKTCASGILIRRGTGRGKQERTWGLPKWIWKFAFRKLVQTVGLQMPPYMKKVCGMNTIDKFQQIFLWDIDDDQASWGAKDIKLCEERRWRKQVGWLGYELS